MDKNTNSFTNDVLSSIQDPLKNTNSSSTLESSSSSTTTSSIFSFFSSISWTTWLAIILLLAFLGFNIFIYLAKGTQDISNFFGPLLKKIVGFFSVTTKQTVDVSAEGTKGVIQTTANVATGTVNAVQQGVQALPPNSNLQGQKYNVQNNQPDNIQNNALNQALNNSLPQQQQKEYDGEYQADNAYSSIQSSKAGWCFIGEDRGTRVCANVTENDKCMSGNIFPSQEICINPNLRP